MFLAYLNASKAFDRNNHRLLFTDLIKHNVLMCTARLLMSWYRHQTIQVKWDTNFSFLSTVTNGERQGEFWVHIYSLFTLMNSQTSWVQQEWDALWEIWYESPNVCWWLCVFGPNISTLHCLRNICSDYAA